MKPPTVPIPEDPVAERVVAVCAAESGRGAKLALGRVDPGDFWEPACRRVLEAVQAHAVELAEAEMAAAPGERMGARLDAVGRLARVERRDLDRWSADAPVAYDDDGRYAARVRDAARRRRAMTVAAELHAAAAFGDADRMAAATAELVTLGAVS